MSDDLAYLRRPADRDDDRKDSGSRAVAGFLQSSLAALASAVIPAGLTYRLSRRVRDAHMTPRQAGTARRIRESGLVRIVPEGDQYKNRVSNYLQYGTPEVVGDTTAEAMGRKWRGEKRFVYSPNFLYSNRPDVFGRRLPAELRDKMLESQSYHSLAPDLAPRTTPLQASVTREAKREKDAIRRLRLIQDRVDAERPGGYVIKPVHGYQSGSGVSTNDVDLAEAYRKYSPHQALSWTDRAGQTHEFSPRDLVPSVVGGSRLSEDVRKGALEKYPDLLRWQVAHQVVARTAGWRARLWSNPSFSGVSDVLVQDRLDIRKHGPVNRWLNRLVNPTAPDSREYRVHVEDGRVLPRTTVDRYGLASQLVSTFGWRPGALSRAEQAVQDLMNRMPERLKNRLSFAFDVADTPAGMKIIEGNPGAYSGFLHLMPGEKFNPAKALWNHKFVSDLQGQDTRLLAGGKALLSGLGGRAGLSLLRKAVGKSDEEQ